MWHKTEPWPSITDVRLRRANMLSFLAVTNLKCFCVNRPSLLKYITMLNLKVNQLTQYNGFIELSSAAQALFGAVKWCRLPSVFTAFVCTFLFVLHSIHRVGFGQWHSFHRPMPKPFLVFAEWLYHTKLSAYSMVVVFHRLWFVLALLEIPTVFRNQLLPNLVNCEDLFVILLSHCPALIFACLGQRQSFFHNFDNFAIRISLPLHLRTVWFCAEITLS